MFAITMRRTVSAAALVLTAASSTAAQSPAWTVGAGAYLESYSFADADASGIKSVMLMTAPFGASFRPVSWANVTLRGAFASATSTGSDDSESSNSGLTDTSLQIDVPVLPGRVVVGATLVLPTGKSTYTADEAQVVGVVAADLLPFRVTNWGSGGALDLHTSLAAPLGEVNVAGTFGYQMAREYDLLEEGDFAYQPGSQLYVGVTADRSIGDSRLAAQVTMYRYGEDAVNSQNLYQAGNRIQGVVSYVTPLGRRGRAQLYGGALRRETGVFVDGSPDTPAQTLLLFGGGIRQPMSFGVLTPSADVRLLRSENGEGQGFVGGIGTGVEMALGSAMLMPSARVRIGRVLVSDGVESGITGFEVGATLRFGTGRP